MVGAHGLAPVVTSDIPYPSTEMRIHTAAICGGETRLEIALNFSSNGQVKV